MTKTSILLAAAAMLLSFSMLCSAETFTYADLAGMMTDMERLAVLPAPGETTAQWSSYDRASKYDPLTRKYEGWDANGDNAGIIRKEGDAEAFAEIEGPGVIWRIWSARPEQGHVKIFLDGAEAPAVDLPFADYFNGSSAPFNYPSLVYDAAMGKNSYVPIPFQKSCKIIGEKGWGAYYHFTYTTFPKGTVVPTFSRDLDAASLAALERVDKFFTDKLGGDPGGKRAGEQTETKTIALAPGETATAFELTGARAITSLRVKAPTGDRSKIRHRLRESAIQISWDGEGSPSVWAPIGDFFGTSPGANEYKSLPMGLDGDSFYSFWYMPFARSAKIELTNDGDEAASIELTVAHAPLTRPIETLGRFHAKWHTDKYLPKEPERAIDWTLLATGGVGRFVGVMLHVFNPVGGWWGEGDEKFFADGEKFPSTIGTGSEDYFGYAWCHPAVFHKAYHNQTYVDRNNKGHVSVNRWHIVDNVPFQKKFEGYIEKYFDNYRPTNYAAVAYWYLAPDGKDPYSAASVSERRKNLDAEIFVYVIKGAIESEKLEILNKTNGTAQPQSMGDFGGQWSNDEQLWWTGAQPGDRLTLALPVEKDGRYELNTQLTKARDYGIVQFYLDGEKIGPAIDLYDPNVVPTGEFSLGDVDLAAGDHEFAVEITGANASADLSYMFGMDYLKLAPIERTK